MVKKKPQRPLLWSVHQEGEHNCLCGCIPPAAFSPQKPVPNLQWIPSTIAQDFLEMQKASNRARSDLYSEQGNLNGSRSAGVNLQARKKQPHSPGPRNSLCSECHCIRMRLYSEKKRGTCPSAGSQGFLRAQTINTHSSHFARASCNP